MEGNLMPPLRSGSPAPRKKKVAGPAQKRIERLINAGQDRCLRRSGVV